MKTNTTKLNKGHYHEIIDRISVVQDIIEVTLRQHHVISIDAKALTEIDKIQLKLGKMYQKFSKRL
jgi:hypothetical protein